MPRSSSSMATAAAVGNASPGEIDPQVRQGLLMLRDLWYMQKERREKEASTTTTTAAQETASVAGEMAGTAPIASIVSEDSRAH